MSGLPTVPLAFPPGGKSLREATRLWPALARPTKRALPAKGMDLAGEWAVGVAQRARFRAGLRRRAERVVELAGALAPLSEAAYDTAVGDARDSVSRGRSDAEVVDRAFAAAYEAVRRTVGLSLYVEQVMGALAIATGCCAEMATGEGKTLTAILPAALHAWSGRGVHVVTVNDYLAQRDASITRRAYTRLGLSVASLADETEHDARRAAYAASITYAADKQVIFDFLRDRLASPLRVSMTRHLLDEIAGGVAEKTPLRARGSWSEHVVQRGLYAAIVDEADSVLIDEAVTPAIIALPPGDDAPWSGREQYAVAAETAGAMEPGRDYALNRRLHRVDLTRAGREVAAGMASRLPAFWAGPRRREELLTQALMARELYVRDDDYIIRDNKIVIVDRSTGRVLDGRQWQLGIHQAVEAKESVEVTDARVTSARVSYQRFFQRYEHLGGMSGTVWETRHELWRDYRLPVVRIPTHRPLARRQLRDRVFDTEEQKFAGVADRAAELHRTGRPVLIGTRSVMASEKLGALLAQRGTSCRILNATREAEEADIVAQAGKFGAVTVATNMAGRGTDIILEPRTRELGGLAVIATERHDESRVDRQLFGRSGRQGDPGLAQAFVALDDQVVVRHGLRTLKLLCRRTHSWLRGPATGLLWWSAQRAASRRAVMMRREVAKLDAWLDLAMHFETR
jgi:preprotein translocase subunit SecA